jgi:hypothetical protein
MEFRLGDIGHAKLARLAGVPAKVRLHLLHDRQLN